MNIILVQLHDALFGLPAEAVTQVVEPAQVTPLPFVPPHVEGLANVGAAVMPVVDLAQRLWDRPGDRESGVFLSVSTEGAVFGLRVTRVQMMVHVPVEECSLFGAEAGAPEDSGVPPEVVAGEFQWQGHMVLLLDPGRLGIQDLEALRPPPAPHAMLAAEPASAGGAATQLESDSASPLMIVETAGERYALPLDKVLESIVVGDLTEVPKAPAEVEGLVSLRGHPLLVVSLGRVLERPAPPSRHAVIIQRDAGRYALGVERVIGLQILASRAREELGDGQGLVSECLIAADGRLIGLLDVARLFGASLSRALSSVLPRGHGDDRAASVRAVEERPLLTFWVGQELCGLDLDTVSRVVDWHEPTPLPHGQDETDNVAGMLEVAGDILPVVDLRRRFGSPSGLSTGAAYVVARESGTGWALTVDRLNRIIRLPVDQIRPTGGGRHYAAEVGQLNGALVNILALNRLVCG